ncbi:sensor histidine kinase [Halomonas heilongjiangensis]|uniref:histidine kinase n=1 Tax=Halomonas heilongjiangensis TaxID=1387883 RepID=A0A2N7TG53_9GAMM|nr:sensor histidine kinase [Halomonas heilongjiangensis]PMR67163.1 ATP-binding protein [Halomonas heilongjiangensis]PXX87902.1 ATP-binding protein [Halomonas heilongjiangensis]
MRHVDRRSLRFRLLTWLGGVAVIVVGVTWLLHGILLHDLARGFLGERLRQEAEHTLQQFRQEQDSLPAWLESAGGGYQVFHHLYALRLDGEITTSHPRWLAPLEPHLKGDDDTLVDIHWQGRQLLAYRKVFTLDGHSGVLLIGEDFAQVAAGLTTLHWWVGGIAGVLLMLLVALNLIAVNRGLRPLSRLQRQLDELQSGERERLRLDTPSELDNLVAQLNRFMDDQDRRLQRSRESVANLSHALKTPLAAVTQVLRGSRPIDDGRRAKMLLRLEDMHAQLESELRRSRIAGPYTGQRTLIRREVERLIDMFGALHPDKRFRLAAIPAAEASVSVERQDFTEMLGIVLDNAGKWADREVVCRLELAESLTLTVEDDGPGVSAEDIALLGRRGLRLDEGRPGHGLGLSILRQLVEQYGGVLKFEVGGRGGLRVVITLAHGDPGP